jgi:hypothetical protein
VAKKSFIEIPQPKQPNPDEISRFIEGGTGKDRAAHVNVSIKEPQIQLPIAMPKSLQQRYKAGCARRGIKMAEDIRSYIEKRVKQFEAEDHENKNI